MAARDIRRTSDESDPVAPALLGTVEKIVGRLDEPVEVLGPRGGHPDAHRAGDDCFRVARVVVNGRDGSINAGVAPASMKKAKLQLAGQVAVMVVMAVVFALLAVAVRQARTPMVALAVIVSVAAIYMIWRFRPEREVQYREPFSS